MDTHTDLLLDLNILARATQKYYDRQLQAYDLSYAQLPVLLMIYESEGITANQIVNQGQYDKGTVTKNVQKLEALGYIEAAASVTDKRVRHLYTTDRAKTVIAGIYAIRRDWWNHLMASIPRDQAEQFMTQTRNLVNSAIEASNTESAPLLFYRMDSLSATAWPGKLALVLHTAGCNFRCPGCADRACVMLPEDASILDLDQIRSQVEERKSFIDGVVIAGGEPFLQSGLLPFLRELKATGIPVRIETNGTFPEKLEQCLKEGLADEISLQIRNVPSRYAASAGLKEFDIRPLQKSMQLLEQWDIPWEAVTELDDRYFSDSDPDELAAWLKNARHIHIRNHIQGPRGVDPELGSMAEDQFLKWKERLER